MFGTKLPATQVGTLVPAVLTTIGAAVLAAARTGRSADVGLGGLS